MEDFFVQRFIPNAKALKEKSSVGISIYKSNKQLFALINVDKLGSATKKIKQKVLKKIAKPIKCIFLFRNRLHYVDSAEVIGNTFAWFADSPDNIVYFEDNAKELIPYKS